MKPLFFQLIIIILAVGGIVLAFRSYSQTPQLDLSKQLPSLQSVSEEFSTIQRQQAYLKEFLNP